MQSQWAYHLACYAATCGIICFGPPTDTEEIFVLLDEWVPRRERLDHDESLAELARIYLHGHGPATADDLAWWCGLGKTECKKAISLIAQEVQAIESDGKIYYHFPLHSLGDEAKSLRLLSGFDEYFLGYKDRSRVADTSHHKNLFSTNGIFFPLILE